MNTAIQLVQVMYNDNKGTESGIRRGFDQWYHKS